jgi:hypothetical protein
MVLPGRLHVRGGRGAVLPQEPTLQVRRPQTPANMMGESLPSDRAVRGFCLAWSAFESERLDHPIHTHCLQHWSPVQIVTASFRVCLSKQGRGALPAVLHRALPQRHPPVRRRPLPHLASHGWRQGGGQRGVCCLCMFGHVYVSRPPTPTRVVWSLAVRLGRSTRQIPPLAERV